MATGVGKAADRLQNVHNVHLLICLLAVVFAAVDLFDAEHKRAWVDKEYVSVEPLLRLAQVNVAALREELVRTYGLPGGKPHFESESARVGALVTDMYLAGDYVSKAIPRVLASWNATRGATPSWELLEVLEHLEYIRGVLGYGIGIRRPGQEELQFVNPKLGTIGEPQALTALLIEDLARLAYSASVSPRATVRALSSITNGTGPINATAQRSLLAWVKVSRIELEDKRYLRADASKLWTSWIEYATDRKAAQRSATAPGQAGGTQEVGVAALTSADESLRKLKASLSSTQTIEELFRSLKTEQKPEVHPLLSLRTVKVPGFDINLKFRYMLIVLPWIIALLLFLKYATVHQIHVNAIASQDKIAEMQGEVAGVIPFYSWTGRIAAIIVILFVILSELASICVVPALAWLLSWRNVVLPNPTIFWIGFFVASGLWLLYIFEVFWTRKALKLSQ